MSAPCIPHSSHLARTLTVLISLLMAAGTVQASLSEWRNGHTATSKPAPRLFARKQLINFNRFLDKSLRGDGKRVFQQVSNGVRRNINWHNDQGKNAYIEAFRQSYPFIKSVDLQGMPDIILLMPYLESQWNSQAGLREKDYGYWQIGRYVVEEIQTLDDTPNDLKETHPDRIRSDPALSTKAAQIHLRRYWYYFAKVANLPEADAWLFSITAYNWGAGNVKRMIADMEAEGVAVNFSNFYHRLHATQQRNQGDKSMRAAVEYLPNLWNIAQLIVASG